MGRIKKAVGIGMDKSNNMCFSPDEKRLPLP